jgi:N-acetylmuramidase/Putative peptidoglycan binding domain
MKTIKYNVRTEEVIILCEMLNVLGYNLVVSDSFTGQVDQAVKDFQSKNNLVVDGIVGMKTWSKLFEHNNQWTTHNDKLLSENDLMEFATIYDLELAIIKAVNEVESSGKGFLLNGKPKILFEGHVFWRELKKRGINPGSYLNSNTQDILYEIWTKKFYLGGEGEYNRLQKAINLEQSIAFRDAANSAASWGSFQIMGFHAIPLGYQSVDDFVQKMGISEREHLSAFGRFLEANHLIVHLKNKNWAEFALRYNGAGYQANKYDVKLASAYKKYS